MTPKRHLLLENNAIPLLALTIRPISNRSRPDHLAGSASGQEIRAIGEFALRGRRDAQKAHLQHGLGESRLPLAGLADEALELLADGGGLVGQVDV